MSLIDDRVIQDVCPDNTRARSCSLNNSKVKYFGIPHHICSRFQLSAGVDLTIHVMNHDLVMQASSRFKARAGVYYTRQRVKVKRQWT